MPLSPLDAEWLAHRYDPEHDAIHFLPVSRELHGQAVFLTDEYLPAGLQPQITRRGEALARSPAVAPLHFVFHSAFCCSTLIARAYDSPGWAMGLKEPVILNDIVGWRRRGGRGPDMAGVLDDVLTLLARPFGKGEAVVVKPSNIVNGLASAMLTLRPDARALLLHAPLRTYLASIAKKGMDGRLWVRTLLLGLLDDKLVDFGFSSRDHLGHTDLQVAAVGWLAQHALFAQIADTFGPGRVRTLDSGTLMTDPAEAITRLSGHFDLAIDDRRLDQILKGPAFNRHSKTGVQFAVDDRIDEQNAATGTHSDEIDKVAQWTQAVADTFGISLDLPAPLLPKVSA